LRAIDKTALPSNHPGFEKKKKKKKKLSKTQSMIVFGFFVVGWTVAVGVSCGDAVGWMGSEAG
jgi:hypothetical protein